VRYIASYFGLSGKIEQNVFDFNLVSDSLYLDKKEEQKNQEYKSFSFIELKRYNPDILDKLNYSLKLQPWLNDGISQEAIKSARIGYYLGGDQISIPHYDFNGNFIGLRGRSMCQ